MFLDVPDSLVDRMLFNSYFKGCIFYTPSVSIHVFN